MLSWRAMTASDLDAVLVIEQGAYSHPWTRGQFADSLASGHQAWLLLEDQELLGYYLTMPVLDEVHLLNLTVAPDRQGHGIGRALLTHMLIGARQAGAQSVWLEVRQSNERAQRLYGGHGFERVGLRRDYYPSQGRREAALVMRRLMPADDDALD